jgi:hypothetical protein
MSGNNSTVENSAELEIVQMAQRQSLQHGSEAIPMDISGPMNDPMNMPSSSGDNPNNRRNSQNSQPGGSPGRTSQGGKGAGKKHVAPVLPRNK